MRALSKLLLVVAALWLLVVVVQGARWHGRTMSIENIRK